MSRRTLAKLAAAAAAVPAAAQPTIGNYTGPLTGLDDKLQGRALDPLPPALKMVDAAPRKLRFNAATKQQAVAWQPELRSKLTELLGGFPTSPAPLRPMTIETRSFPTYHREKVLFDSRDGMSVLAIILTPVAAKGPLPVVICVPGHGRGVDDIVGVDDKGQGRTDKAGYQHDFAIQVVEAGMAAVAIEPLGFGCRRDPANKKRGLSTSACQPLAGTALLLGQTMIGWRVYDVMRTIDLIATRPELDKNRIGCVGISGGGTCTLFSAALEPRIKAAFVSGYLNTFRNSIASISHCIDNYVPGILNWAEMYDIAGLVAPRPLFVESGQRDNIFPIQSSLESFAKVKAIYRVFGAEAQAQNETFDDAHSFWGKEGIPFLKQHLSGA